MSVKSNPLELSNSIHALVIAPGYSQGEAFGAELSTALAKWVVRVAYCAEDLPEAGLDDTSAAKPDLLLGTGMIARIAPADNQNGDTPYIFDGVKLAESWGVPYVDVSGENPDSLCMPAEAAKRAQSLLASPELSIIK